VLVTRPKEQARELSAAIRALGGDAVEIPTIRIEPASDLSALDAALARLGDYDALLLASANAARALAGRARVLAVGLDRPGLKVACVGPRTAEAAAQLGIRVDLVASRADGEGLGRAVAEALAPRGRRFLLPRSEIGRDALPEAITAAGGRVDAVPAYRTVAAEADAGALCDRLEAGTLDALTFTSPSTVQHFLAMLRPAARAAAGRCVVAALGETTAAALGDAGLPPQVVPERPEAAALAEALAAYFTEAGAVPKETS